MEYSEFALGLFSGLIITFITQIIVYYLSKKNSEAQQEHNLRIAKMHLYHEDRKKALIKLDEIVKKTTKTFPDFKKNVDSFLDESSGIFLPEKLRNELKGEMTSISISLSEIIADFYGSEPEFSGEDYEEWTQSLSPDEVIDEQIKTRLSGLRSLMRNRIRKYLSEES